MSIQPARPKANQPKLMSGMIARTTGSFEEEWWSQTGSNRRPQACKASALPTELWPRISKALGKPLASLEQTLVGPGRFELPTPRLSSVCSNQLSYGPTPAAVAETGLAIPLPFPKRDRLGGREVHGRETETAVKPLLFCRDVQPKLDSPTARELSK
jgi:hypothetical protein